MKQKINLRLIGIAVIAVLATAIGITFIYYGLFKKQVQAGLRTNAEVLMETGVFEKSSQYADVKLPINNLRVTWIDSDGVVLFDNDNDINVMPNHKDRPEIQDAFHTGHGQCVRNSDTMDMNTFYIRELQDMTEPSTMPSTRLHRKVRMQLRPYVIS